MLNPALLAALGNILPATAILTATEDTRPYECDGLTLFREQPQAVLLPETEAQVVGILKLCHAARLHLRGHTEEVLHGDQRLGRARRHGPAAWPS